MTEQEWLDIFADNLRDMMRDFGISQRELADETGLSESTIGRYLKKQMVPGIKALVNIAYVLDCSLDDLMDFGSRIR